MSIERAQRKGGEVVWRVRCRDTRGRNRSKILGSKADAVVFDAEVRRRKRTGELASLDGGRETLDGYVAGTWANAHAIHLAASTRTLYADTYDRHIAPHLGGLRLQDITPETIGHWQADLVGAGVGKVTVKKASRCWGTSCSGPRKVGASPRIRSESFAR